MQVFPHEDPNVDRGSQSSKDVRDFGEGPSGITQGRGLACRAVKNGAKGTHDGIRGVVTTWDPKQVEMSGKVTLCLSELLKKGGSV